MKLYFAAAAAASLLFTAVPGHAHPSRAEPPPVPPPPAAGAPPVVSPPAAGAPPIVPPPPAGAPHTETGAVDGAYPAMPFDPVRSRTAADLQAFWNAMMRVKAGQNAAMTSQATLAAQREEQAEAAIDLLAARIRRNDLQGTATKAARRLYTDEPARTPLLESLGVDDEAERATADAERAAATVGNREVRLAAASRAVLGTSTRLATERRQLAKDEAALTVLRRWADQYAAQARRWRAAPAPNVARAGHAPLRSGRGRLGPGRRRLGSDRRRLGSDRRRRTREDGYCGRSGASLPAASVAGSTRTTGSTNCTPEPTSPCPQAPGSGPPQPAGSLAPECSGAMATSPASSTDASGRSA